MPAFTSAARKRDELSPWSCQVRGERIERGSVCSRHVEKFHDRFLLTFPASRHGTAFASHGHVCHSCFEGGSGRAVRPPPDELDCLGHLRAVGRAAALSLAAVLALAAVVARLAAALALAVVLALTGVLGRLVRTGQAHSSLCSLDCGAIGTGGGRLGRYGGSTDQSGERRRQKQCIQFATRHLKDLTWGLRRKISAVVSMQAREKRDLSSSRPKPVAGDRIDFKQFPAPHTRSTDLRQRLQGISHLWKSKFVARSRSPTNRSLVHGVKLPTPDVRNRELNGLESLHFLFTLKEP